MKYLIRKTTKHLTRAHLIGPDGKQPYCDRSNLVAGERGWQVVECDKADLCWHCYDKRKRNND